MTTPKGIEGAIKLAIEGGFSGFIYGGKVSNGWAGSKSNTIKGLISEHAGDILICPDFWQCLGKALGWAISQEPYLCKDCF